MHVRQFPENVEHAATIYKNMTMSINTFSLKHNGLGMQNRGVTGVLMKLISENDHIFLNNLTLRQQKNMHR